MKDFGFFREIDASMPEFRQLSSFPSTCGEESGLNHGQNDVKAAFLQEI
jgi:hypothetical protein